MDEKDRERSSEEIYCWNCGIPISRQAVICVHCGVSVREGRGFGGAGGKSKTTAILLAIFLGYWSWLYTVRKDWWKFMIGILGAPLAAFPVSTIIYAHTSSAVGHFAAYSMAVALVSLPIWLWSVITTSLRSYDFYASYDQ